MQTTNELDAALRYIGKHIYEQGNEAFRRDRRALLYATDLAGCLARLSGTAYALERLPAHAHGQTQADS